MKQRIKIDSSILSAIIILTGFLYLFPQLYPQNQTLDNVLDFLGLIIILKGTYLRMVSRGHKKAYSKKGKGLVTTGIYTYVRNPMYSGSFFIGTGFVLIVWPWWSLPIFGVLFYQRFKFQVIKEEEHLKKLFGETYQEYCQKVPRIFPRWQALKKVNVRKMFGLKEAFSTKEKRGLISWPLLAVVLESLQETIVFRVTNLGQTIAIFLLAVIFFMIVFWYRYRIS